MPTVSPSVTPAAKRRFSLFAYGFRPFFLLAAIQAAVAVPLWLALYGGRVSLPTTFAPSVWHAHEMLFGFVPATLAGFFLTAVPNWTGMPPLAGWRLVGLATIWLAGRIAFWCAAFAPPWLVAAVDLAFIPALAATVGPYLLRSDAKRQRVFMVIFALLWTSDLLIHLTWLGGVWTDPRRGIYLALDTYVLLLSVIGGRIVPAFTSGALRKAGVDAALNVHSLTEKLALGSTALIIPVELLLGDSVVTGAVCLIAAVAQAVRLYGWHSRATVGEPILWVLHLAYAWIPVGLAMRGLDMTFGVVSASVGLHALTIGAIGSMTLGVMSRASLGHTGRAIEAAPAIVVAYFLISLAALIRVLGATLAPAMFYRLTLDFSGAAWTLGWLLFLAVYAPKLIRPRIDGQPG